MKKSNLILISLFSVLIILFGIALTNVDYLLEKYIKEELDRIIESSDHPLYEFKYKEVDFHVWNGDFEISGVQIEPKPGIVDSVENGNIRSFVSAKLNNLSIIGFSFWEFYENKNLEIDEIRIVKPLLNYSFNPEVKAEKKAFNLHKLFTKRLKLIKVEKINFQNVNFNFNNVLRKNLLLEIDSMNMEIHNMVFDSITIKKPIPVSYSGINLFINKVSANISKYYMMETGHFNFNSEKKLLEIDSIKLIPKYTIPEFHKMITSEKAYLKIKANQLQISGIDIDSIRNNRKFYFHKILVKNPNIITYKDKRLNDPPYKYKKLLSQMIREIPIDFKIDTVRVENGYIKVQTIGEKVPQTVPGEISFNSAYLNIFGLTNDSTFLEKRPIMGIYFNSRFMGVANLNAQIIMPIFHNRNNFKIKGELAEMDATVLSELLNRVLLVNINTGKIRSIDFEFKADNDSARGYIDISYQNLKVDIKSTKDPKKSMKFMNAMVNAVAKKDNIKGTPNFTRGFIKYKRDYNKKFINYLWLALQNGIINTFLLSKEVKTQSKEFKKENKRNIKLFKKNKKTDNDNQENQ